MIKLNELTWKEILGYHKANTIEELNEFIKRGFHIVECDASYKDKAGTCSIRIRNGGKENKTKNKKFVAVGPNEAEIISILHGIREAKNIKSIQKAIFANDNLQAVSLVVGGYNPQQENIKKAVGKVKIELAKLDFPYEFALVRSKVNRKVDKSAKKHLIKREAEIKSNIEKRIKKVQRAKERCKGLKCIKTSKDKFLVYSSNSDSEYIVDIENLYCTCPSWKNNWGNKEAHTIFSRALPCKHMCRAAELDGQDIFEIFKSQIFRRR